MSALQKNINEDACRLFLQDHVEASRLVNHVLNGTEYLESPFESIISETLEKTYTGEIENLIISMPPGLGKTSRAVWTYAARGFAINPKARFVHLTFSDKLVQSNSAAIKEVIESPEYQCLFPDVKIKPGTSAKGLWETTAGGRFVASPSGGQVTGFRGGVTSMSGFAGAILMDDMTSTESIYSIPITDSINRRWPNKFRSRKAIGSRAPFILTMQRLGPQDFTNYLLNQSGIKWHHLVLPILIKDDYVYTDGGIIIDHGLPSGSLWPEMWSNEEAEVLNKDVQYSQDPTQEKGDVFEKEWFLLYDPEQLPSIKSWHIYADTASKTEKYNDYTCFQLWGLGYDNNGYLISQYHDKIKVPYLKDRYIRFYDESVEFMRDRYLEETAFQATPDSQKPTNNIEDKDSGVGLIQALQMDRFAIRKISRSIGKYARFTKAAPQVRYGKINLPLGKSLTHQLIKQAIQFKEDDSHAHDDMLDPLCDFINDHFVTDAGFSVQRSGIF